MTYLRAVAVTLALAGACSDPDPAHPAGLDGSWDLAWSCESGCNYRPPAVTLAATLTIDADAATWTPAPPLRPIGHAGRRNEDCLSVPSAWGDTVGRGRDEYSICLADGAVSAVIREHSGDGAEQTTWSADGAR